jgi:hypothetical protein
VRLDEALIADQYTLVLLCGIALATMIGIGVLGRPANGTRLWALSFLAAMVMAAALIVAEATQYSQLGWFAFAMAYLPAGMIWGGFRRRRGLVSHWKLVVGSSLLLSILFFTFSPVWAPWVALAVQIFMFCAEMLSYVLLSIEMMRSPEGSAPILRPLLYATTIIPFMGIVMFIFWANMRFADSEATQYLAQFMAAASSVFLVCALTSLAGYSAPPKRSAEQGQVAYDSFESRAQHRLRVAELRNESGWSLIVFRLDDAADLQAAVGSGALSIIGDRLEELVLTSFPSWAEVSRRDTVSVCVLCAGSVAMVRSYVSRALRRIVDDEQASPLAVKHSASAGWSSVETQGYEFEELLIVAEDCLELADERGGDRWERR